MRSLTVIENPNDMIVATLIVHVGSIDESPQHYGISHLLEHMMFSTKKSSSKLVQELARSGTIFNAYTDYDKTQYFVMGHVSVWEKILRLFKILALEAPDFTEAELKVEVDVVLEELSWRSGMEGDDGGGGGEGLDIMIEYFWKNTAYEHPVGGSARTLRNITKADLVAYHDRYYGDSHLWISAPTSIAAKVNAFVKAEYPPVPSPSSLAACPIVRPYDILKIKAGQNRATLAVDAAARATTIVLLMRSVPYGAVETTYIDLIAHELAGLDGLLSKHLRDDKGLTYGVPVGNISYVDNGIFQISMVSTQTDAVRLIDAFLEPLQMLRARRGFSRAEFESYKKSFLLKRATALQDAFELTMILSQIEFYSGMRIVGGLKGYVDFLERTLDYDAFKKFADDFFKFSKANLFMHLPQQRGTSANERVVKKFSDFLKT